MILSLLIASHFVVAVTDASRGAFPYHLPTVTANLEAVGVVPCFVLVAHETKESHVYRCHAELEGLKVQTEVLSETMEHLIQQKHSVSNLRS